MQTHFPGHTSQRQTFDALAVVVEADASQLAEIAVAELRPGDRFAVAEQLRYLANLIEKQP